MGPVPQGLPGPAPCPGLPGACLGAYLRPAWASLVQSAQLSVPPVCGLPGSARGLQGACLGLTWGRPCAVGPVDRSTYLQPT